MNACSLHFLHMHCWNHWCHGCFSSSATLRRSRRTQPMAIRQPIHIFEIATALQKFVLNKKRLGGQEKLRSKKPLNIAQAPKAQQFLSSEAVQPMSDVRKGALCVQKWRFAKVCLYNRLAATVKTSLEPPGKFNWFSSQVSLKYLNRSLSSKIINPEIQYPESWWDTALGRNFAQE